MRDSRIVWSGPDCLLGQSIPITAWLSDLTMNGCRVEIIGASVTAEKEMNSAVQRLIDKTPEAEGKVLAVQDGRLKHNLVRTVSRGRDDMTNREQNLWYRLYIQLLDNTCPDLVLLQGDRMLERFAMQEAKLRGIPSAAIVPAGTVNALSVDAQLKLPASKKQLMQTLSTLLARRAGDRNQQATLQASHLLLGRTN